VEGDFSSFNVTDDTGKSFTARKIVLGTGLRDLLPATPGLREAFGKGIFWCPWCDGYGEYYPERIHERVILRVFRTP
jgi:Thioredoxin reductase